MVVSGLHAARGSSGVHYISVLHHWICSDGCNYSISVGKASTTSLINDNQHVSMLFVGSQELEDVNIAHVRLVGACCRFWQQGRRRCWRSEVQEPRLSSYMRTLFRYWAAWPVHWARSLRRMADVVVHYNGMIKSVWILIGTIPQLSWHAACNESSGETLHNDIVQAQAAPVVSGLLMFCSNSTAIPIEVR